jgi:glutamate/tyrosine decarboxylase-like PLP-dependent enzyme
MSHHEDLEFLGQVAARLGAAMAEGLAGKGPVRGPMNPKSLAQELEPFTAHWPTGLPRDQWLVLLDRIVALSTRSLHPGFLNQLYGGLQAPGLAGDWLGSVLNMSMATLEIAPLATVLEGLLFQRARQLVGFPQLEDLALQGGTLVPGGSNGNMVALLVARNTLFPQTKTHGLHGSPGPLCFFVSSEAHYSFEKAANAMGLGTSSVWPVPVDHHGRMDPEGLRKTVHHARSQGFSPFFVGATSGTTVRAAFDPLDAIADVCAAEKLWLHVDAALGGSLLFSDVARSMLAGIYRADSVVWDAHKLMNVPLVASILLCRDPKHLVESNTGGGEDYLFHARSDERWDSGVASLQCGRRADVFKIVFAWLMTGEQSWGRTVDEHLARTQRFGARVAQDPRFELVHPVESVTLCFRVRGPAESLVGPVKLDQLELRETLLREGRFMVNYAQDHGGQPFFRLVSLNNLVTDDVFEQLFADLLRCAGHTQSELA